MSESKIPFKEYPIENYLPQERLELPVCFEDGPVITITVTIEYIEPSKNYPIHIDPAKKALNFPGRYTVIFKEASEALEITEGRKFKYAGNEDC